MKIALYPGSFNPWHAGHEDVLLKACSIFDTVLVCQMVNGVKGKSIQLDKQYIEKSFGLMPKNELSFDVVHYNGLLVDAVKKFECKAVVRGIRNAKDFEYEKDMMYWNHALGLEIPTVCFISEQNLTHLSSSGLRELGTHTNRLITRYT